ncbi:acyl-CoA dehydrogenase family protein [Minwuia thermotolerans]|uniref:Acyl-CoA dehydrogenase n=1 Tax=Minwuia thermotolerans TaxID=2056226 RepID=A0A2M9FVR2_9PROT|nr:acyl-CoA dehydrogenase family protein [Minwuia thermotolerans]PJK27550.1 acyl-CoA dehydrogenase [Minwuia thermotolerans]
MSELRNILTDSVNGLFGDRVTKELLTQFDADGNDGGLWDEVEAQGLTRPLVSEENGGVGGEWRDAHVLLYASGYHCAPVPMGETILATWLAEKAGLPVPDGVSTVIDGRDTLKLAGGKLSGAAGRVPWARKAGHAIFVAEDEGGPKIGLLDLSQAKIGEGENVAKEPRDDVTVDGVPVETVPLPNDMPADGVLLYGAMIRAAQLAGALEKVLQQAVQYANERTQFGRPIGKFQAIQQELAKTAGEAAASGVIAEAPFAALDEGRPAEFLIAAAKARASEAAGIAASVGHQTHGAIGFTYEHSLHFATRRLWSWRSEFGGQRFWWRRLGERSVGRGPDMFWPDITG